MAATTQQQRLTLEEFLALPEREPALEYEAGEIAPKVAPQGQHSALQSELIERINRFARPARRAWAFPELRVTVGEASRVPDIAVYRWERIPRTGQGEIANQFREPPDVVIEIVSPDQSVAALVRRCLAFLADGVQVAALVDPADRSVLLFRRGQEPRALRGDDVLEFGEALPGFQLPVRALFAVLDLG